MGSVAVPINADYDPKNHWTWLRNQVQADEWLLPEVLEALDEPETVYHDQNYRVEAEQWYCDRLVLIGDAAHAMTFGYVNQLIRIGSAIALCLLLAWIYRQLPNDVAQGNTLRTLDQHLSAVQVGQKAATLSDLKRAGYPVAEGWAVPKGEDLQPVLDTLNPTKQEPLIVRSSAVGEDEAGGRADQNGARLAESTPN